MSYELLAHLVTFRPLDRPIESEGRVSSFRAPISKTVRLLASELRAIDAERVVLQVDVREQDLRLDGLPRAKARASSPAVVLAFDSRVGPLRYEVGTYSRWEDNLRAIALGLKALRAVDRYGVTKRGEQYAGWRALPLGSGAPSADRGRELVEEYGGVTEAIKATHPDRNDGARRDFEHVMAYRESVGAAA